MNIIKVSENGIKESSTDEIIDRLFIIFKEDSSFNNSKLLEEMEINIEELKKKITKQDTLISKSEEIKKSIKSKSLEIENNIDKMRNKILEILGSEL